MKRLIVSFAVLALLTAPAGAQSNILGRLGERAKNAVENKLGEKVDKGVDNLPTGYKMVVMDITKGMKQMEEMEQKWKTAEDQMKGLQGKSTEELLQMLKKN